jgi:predicted DNA binding CopG/RHH family protein
VTKFPERFGPDTEVSEVDLDKEPLVYHGREYDEAGAQVLAEEILARTRGRPSLSGERAKSPSLTIRLPKSERARLDETAARQGRRASQVVREALHEYLERHAG